MPSDGAIVLAFDTSAAHCAAALIQGDVVLAEKVEPMLRGQAERILPMLEELLSEAGRSWADVDAIGVCTGPGNFTGVRIGVAAARGLSLALDVPAVGVTSFELIGRRTSGEVSIELADRTGTVFAQPFRDGAPTGPIEATMKAIDMGQDAAPTPALLARIVRDCTDLHSTPPAPLYLRAADAAPSSQRAPALIDDA